MEETIKKRFEDLIEKGREISRKVSRMEYWVGEFEVPEVQAWLSSVFNLLRTVCEPHSYFVDECKQFMAHEDLKTGISVNIVNKIFGLLNSAKEEYDRGLLKKVEYMVAATTFDDFLDHAAEYHKGNKHIEASVLGSAVLEDSVKKIANKNEIESHGRSLEHLIDNLVKNGVFTPVKAKRIKSSAGVRNHALHAEWEKFDILDVGDLIKTTRELIDQYL